ncbi:MAG: class I SAM-dependent methyltransferase [Hellea sp.]|nr:class I SAM-dependent methyltransferase [Hellea sp.]
MLASVGALTVSACAKKVDKTPETKIEETVREVAPRDILADILTHPRRAEEAKRDMFRHPKETLEFFEVGPGKHVAEVWPGWYTNILAPYAKETGGTYTAILYPENMGDRAIARVAAFKEKYADTEIYGDIQYGAFGKDHGAIMAPESVDVIITFRNVHNWMGSGYVDQAFAEFYAALKPGGILGVVEHRLPETMSQDPRGATGYVQESYIKDLAGKAGFEFVASSEINANAKDTADHPFGVWTLPPRSRLPDEGTAEATDFNAEAYKNIGESDRATLKFRKPL